LSWAINDNPTPEHMQAVARASLEALGLSEHEALIAGHSDKEHHHVHVVANTVHPYTGKTAPLKFSKLEFSKWAEAYEREHGIHCEQRIKNNKQREEIAKQRASEKILADFAKAIGQEPPVPEPYQPVKDDSPNRRRWFERQEIIDKMKALRAALDQEHKTQRGSTWAKQLKERDQVDRDTRKALDTVRASVKDDFKGKWRDLYQAQKRETRHLSKVATHPLERAVYVFRNRGRLGEREKPLTLRQMIPLILSGRKLIDRVLRAHDRERRALARSEKAITKHHTDRMWQSHRATFHAVRDRQAAERAAEKAHHQLERKDISFMRAKAELVRDQDQVQPEIPPAPAPAPKPQPPEADRQPTPKAEPPAQPKQPEPEKPTPAAILKQERVPPGIPVAARAKPTPEQVLKQEQLPTGIPIAVRAKPTPEQVLKHDRLPTGIPSAHAKPTPESVLKPDKAPAGVPVAAKAPPSPPPPQSTKPFRQAASPPAARPDPKRAFRNVAPPVPPKPKAPLMQAFRDAAKNKPAEPAKAVDLIKEFDRQLEKFKREHPNRDFDREL
jgi:hypothetical protein